VIVHLNGQLLPASEARISPFDRGFIFGDGIYEGLRSFAGKMRAMDRHIARMSAGLRESRIPWDASRLTDLSLELIGANSLPDAFVYWQITRGTPAPGQPVRSRIPAGPIPPTVFGYCAPVPAIEAFTEPPTIRMSTRPDLRWHRGHLKSISLMGGVLSALEASDTGGADSLLIRDGLVAEGTYANVVIVLPKNEGRHDGDIEIVTPSLNRPSILAGVTRSLELDACPELIERTIREEELARASEIMLVGTTTMITSVTHLDGRAINAGKPGPIARKLLQALVASIRRDLHLPDSAAAARSPVNV
jgi:D-alanine transaminase